MRARTPPGPDPAPGDRAAAQCAVDVDRPAGDHLGARGDGADHRHVAAGEGHGLPRAHGRSSTSADGSRSGGGSGSGGAGGVARHQHRQAHRAPAGQHGRQARQQRPQRRLVRILDADDADGAGGQVLDQRDEPGLACRPGPRDRAPRGVRRRNAASGRSARRAGSSSRRAAVRHEHHGHERAAAEAEEGAGACCIGHSQSAYWHKPGSSTRLGA